MSQMIGVFVMDMSSLISGYKITTLLILKEEKKVCVDIYFYRTKLISYVQLFSNIDEQIDNKMAGRRERETK